MRIRLLLLLAGIAFISMIAAARQKPDPDRTASPEFTSTATIKDIMVSMVDPSADFLWESVATVFSANGRQTREPGTDKAWAEVRRNTIVLLESTNLLMMPGRHVAAAGDKSKNPGVELSPDQIEVLLSQDRESWNKLSRGLYDATLLALNAVDARDARALMDSGAGIDRACESCHQKYWYPMPGLPTK